MDFYRSEQEHECNKKAVEKEAILLELRKSGCRITNQRKILIDAILENECASCKEIYYEAAKKDSGIGIATVYRMVKTLEDIGAIDRKNQYRVSFDSGIEGNRNGEDQNDGNQESYMIVLKNKTTLNLTKLEFCKALKEGLKNMGLIAGDEIEAIVL